MEGMSAVRETERSQRLEAQLRALPDQPGVYLFHGGEGEVLYVGKAKSLRKRVSSYFRRDLHATVKTAGLVGRIEEIEFVAAGSETEALLLEQNLIKRHRRSEERRVGKECRSRWAP